jgi:hypothetical protein
MTHVTKEIPGPTYPQFWNFRHGIDILMGSKCTHVFIMGADSILERPEGIEEIEKLLGDNDIIACSTKNPIRHKAPYCNSKSLLAKKEAFKALVDYIEKGFVPLDRQYGNMENRFGKAVKELQLKEVPPPELPEEDQFAHHYGEDGVCTKRGTWGDILGYRHLGGEHKIRRLKKIIPIEEEYYDKTYLRRYELDTLVQYWKTKDKKHLEAWWKHP